jgi:CubicO group peptidase (beta-lactamase class C family)
VDVNILMPKTFCSISNLATFTWQRRILLALIVLVPACGGPNAGAQTNPPAKPAGNAAASSGQEARIQRIEAQVLDLPMGEKEPPLRLNLAQAMQVYNVPGLSVAVIDNYQIAWAKGYGVIEAG